MHEKTINCKTVFSGRLLKVDLLEVELESGIRSTREIVRHPGAVAVLARAPDGRLVFVRQFRKPLEAVTLEVVAGTLKPGEDPELCARREVHEETGYDVAAIQSLGIIVPAPGYTDERLYVYSAALRPSARAARPDEDEKLEVVRLSAAEFETRIARGEIIDAKTLSAWLLDGIHGAGRRPAGPKTGKAAGRAAKGSKGRAANAGD